MAARYPGIGHFIVSTASGPGRSARAAAGLFPAAGKPRCFVDGHRLDRVDTLCALSHRRCHVGLESGAFSALLGMAGATLTSQLYAWLVTGELESLLAARGLAAGWGAALAAAPFVPPWAALVIGLLGGLLFSFIMYLTNVIMRLRDAAATVALGLVGGLWGLLAVALFADGRAGQGWNGITSIAGLGGVRGVFFGGAGQLTAQLVGIVAVGVWGLFWGVLLGVISNPRMFRRKPAPVVDAGISSDAVLPPEVLPFPSDVLSVKADELVPPEVISEAGGQVPSPIVDEDPVAEPEESPLT